MSKNELLEILFQTYKERKIDPSDVLQGKLKVELDLLQKLLNSLEDVDTALYNGQIDAVCYLREEITYRAGLDTAMALIKG